MTQVDASTIEFLSCEDFAEIGLTCEDDLLVRGLRFLVAKAVRVDFSSSHERGVRTLCDYEQRALHDADLALSLAECGRGLDELEELEQISLCDECAGYASVVEDDEASADTDSEDEVGFLVKGALRAFLAARALSLEEYTKHARCVKKSGGSGGKTPAGDWAASNHRFAII